MEIETVTLADGRVIAIPKGAKVASSLDEIQVHGQAAMKAKLEAAGYKSDRPDKKMFKDDLTGVTMTVISKGVKGK